MSNKPLPQADIPADASSAVQKAITRFNAALACTCHRSGRHQPWCRVFDGNVISDSERSDLRVAALVLGRDLADGPVTDRIVGTIRRLAGADGDAPAQPSAECCAGERGPSVEQKCVTCPHLPENMSQPPNFTGISNAKPALQRIAELLEDGEGPDLEDLLADDTKRPRLSAEERAQLAIIVRWARLPADGVPVGVDALMQRVEELFAEGIAQERSGIKDSNITYRMFREIRAIASGVTAVRHQSLEQGGTDDE